VITSDEAQRIATQVIGPPTAADGQGWHLEEFDAGWLVREAGISEESVWGGSLVVVERATGRVLSFPSSISPTRIKTDATRSSTAPPRCQPTPTGPRRRRPGPKCFVRPRPGMSVAMRKSPCVVRSRSPLVAS
jgi:hypothetical protein